MEWKKITILTTEEAEECVSALLEAEGITGVEIADGRIPAPEESGGLFGDVVPDLPEDDGSARVSFYLEEAEDEAPVVARLTEGLNDLKDLVDIGAGQITVSRTAEEEWINNWKAYFHAFSVGDIAICPSWEEIPEEMADADILLRIDPGTAFGTGQHESTQLAILALSKYLQKGDTFLDVGTGSGILGMVALKRGASHVLGTDIDENVLPAVRENLARNAIDPAEFEVRLGNLIDDAALQAEVGTYDIAAANIIAEILVPLMPEIPKHLKKGGIYVTSGILTIREDMVLAAAARAGLETVEVRRMGEWSGIVFRRR